MKLITPIGPIPQVNPKPDDGDELWRLMQEEEEEELRDMAKSRGDPPYSSPVAERTTPV